MTGPLLASGREADVYALSDTRVLRRYRRAADDTGEAEAMRYLAGAGYPVPVVHEASGRDLVVERLDGPTMAKAVIAGDLAPADGAAQLAGLLGRLHSLPPWPGAPDGTCRLLDDAVALRRGQLDTLTADEIGELDTAAELVRR